jgi:hypothetical protein
MQYAQYGAGKYCATSWLDIGKNKETFIKKMAESPDVYDTVESDGGRSETLRVGCRHVAPAAYFTAIKAPSGSGGGPGWRLLKANATAPPSPPIYADADDLLGAQDVLACYNATGAICLKPMQAHCVSCCLWDCCASAGEPYAPSVHSTAQ